jgi:hypothetical protein
MTGQVGLDQRITDKPRHIGRCADGRENIRGKSTKIDGGDSTHLLRACCEIN